MQHMVESDCQFIPIQIDLNVRSLDTESKTSYEHIDVALMNDFDDEVVTVRTKSLKFINSLHLNIVHNKCCGSLVLK